MSLVLIASMSHENVVWVINQSDGWVCRTEQLQAFPSGVFPVLLIIISQPGLGWDTITITPASSQLWSGIRSQYSFATFSCNLIQRQSKKLSAYRAFEQIGCYFLLLRCSIKRIECRLLESYLSRSDPHWYSGHDWAPVGGRLLLQPACSAAQL